MKKKLSILAVLLLAVTISAYSVGGTYAKYTTTANVTGTAPVAKWAIAMKSGGQEITTTFDLVSTRKDTVDSNAEADVAAGKIAPGTYGNFALEVDGTGTEVSFNYGLTFTVTNMPTNLKFYSNADMTTEITATDGVYSITSGTVAVDAESKIAQSTVYWKWVYENAPGETANDEADTTNGLAAANMTVSATVTATQVD